MYQNSAGKGKFYGLAHNSAACGKLCPTDWWSESEFISTHGPVVMVCCSTSADNSCHYRLAIKGYYCVQNLFEFVLVLGILLKMLFYFV